MKRTNLQLTFLALCCWLASGSASAQSKFIQAVDEYRPAPGQHVNDVPLYEDGDTPEIMAHKCTELLANDARHLVSLGGWGGYITFHFDHPVANISGQRDFAIWGNAYQEYKNIVYGGMNEAGIVMVSCDDNGNHLPDDKWYELKGSCDEDSVGLVDYGYQITYHKNPMGNIPWTDNRGDSGTIDRNRWHLQEYYPQWLPDSLTFCGTRLPRNGWDSDHTGTYWVLISFRWGYADNHPNTLSDFETPDTVGCGFDISWAVDENRLPVQLHHIDFVRVYTALNQKCGWLGETSTEIQGAEDLHLEASLLAASETAGCHGVRDDGSGNATAYTLRGKNNATTYSLSGRKIQNTDRGRLYIKGRRKFTHIH